MPVYKVGEDIYNIPEDKVQEFLSAYPNAVLNEEAGKTQPQVSGAPVEETAAPGMESKSESTSSVSRTKKYKVGDDTYEIPENLTDKFLAQYPDAEEKKDNFFQQMATAWSGGQIQADLDDYLSKAIFSDKYAENISDEDAQKLLDLWQKQDASGLTEGEEQWEKDFDAISTANTGIVPDWFAGAVGATIRNPQAALLYGARSFAMMFSKENIGLGAAGAATAAGAGAALGSVAPGIGTAIGGAGGAIKGAMAGLGASVELFAAFGETIRESLPEDYTVEDIQEAFKDEELLTRARNRAATRAGTIAAFDLVAAGGGSKVAGAISKKALAKGVSKKAGAVAAGTAEGLITTTGEFTGELAAQKAAGDELDFKEAVLEVFGVSPTAIGGQVQTARNLTKSPKYKIDGKEMSRAEVNKFIDDNDGMDLSRVNITVENDNLLRDKLVKKEGIARKKILIDKNITDDAARTRIAELEFERDTLASNKTLSAQERRAEVEEEIKTIQAENRPGKGRPTKLVQEQRKEIEAKAEELKVIFSQRRVADTTAFAQRAMEQTRGMLDVESFDSTDTMRKKLFKDFMGDKESLKDLEANILKRKIKIGDKEVNALDLIGGIAYGGKIYINKQVAAKTGQINVGAHEVLHGIINTKVSQDKLGGIISSFRSQLSNSDLSLLDNELQRRGYKPDAINNETLTVFSDLVAKNQIKFNEGLFNKIGDFIVTKILRPLGFKQVGFENGKQVYQFMKEYQKSVSKGELNQATLDAINRAADVRASKPKIQLSKVDVNSFVTTNSLEEWKASGADEVIANLYFEDYFDKIAEVQMAKPFDKSKTTMLRDLPGFLPEDFKSEFMNKMIQHIRNFDPSKNDSLEGWINSQISNKVKQVLKEGKVTTQTFEEDIDSGRQFAADDSYEMASDFDQADEFDFDVADVEADAQGNLINPLDFLDEESKSEYRFQVAEALAGIDKITDVTFKNLEDKVPQITERAVGIPAAKLVNPKTNITTGQVIAMQDFVIEHVDKLIKLLPEGAVLEAASEKLIGTGTGLPRKLLDAFYIKNPRLKQDQGLYPFSKLEDITKEEFFEAFGIKPDGTKIPFGGQDPRAQALFALARLVGKLMTNTAIRQELEKQQASRNVIVDIGAGRSEFQLSIELDEEIAQKKRNIEQEERDRKEYAKIHSDNIKERKRKLKNLGLTDEQIALLEKESTKYGISKKGYYRFSEKFLKEYKAFAEDLSAFIPPQLQAYGLTGVFKAMIGEHYMYTAKNMDFTRPSRAVVNENGDPISIDAIKELEPDINSQFEKSLDTYPEYLNNAIKAFEDVFYKKDKDGKFRISPKTGRKIAKKGAFLNTTKTGDIKKYYRGLSEEKFENTVQNVFDKENDVIRLAYHNAMAMAFHAYLENQKTGKAKFEALKNFKKILSVSGIADGFKAAVKLGGFVYDNSNEKLGYHVEHVVPAVDMYTELFDNLITGKKKYKNLPEAWFLPKWMVNEFDATFLKTASKEEFMKALAAKTEEAGVKLVIPGNNDFQLSIELPLTEMVDNSLNEMVSEKLNIENKSEISEFQARRLGKNKGRFKFFIPPSADDFMGLMYYLVRKGRQGDADLAFIKKTLIDPFAKAQRVYEEYKMNTLKSYRKLKKSIRNTPAGLKKEAVMGFTNEQALRVFMWNELGYEVPGINQSEISAIREYVSNNKELLDFSRQVQNMLMSDFPQPQESWASGSLTIDILEHINEQARKEFFADFISVAEETFGKMDNRGEIQGPLANKLRAAFGNNYVEALSDVLYRMKVGRSRQFGRNRLVSQLENYINGSIATIMFFNTRSAILQMVSFVNFINFSDNNPIAAAQAYANLPQLSKDVMELMNSDYLVSRRNGLKIDVAADDIAKSAESSANKAGAAITAILRAGYLPTQFADSFAIAFGGATFFRNRINTYMREGLSESEAKEKAYNDWKENAEESQQSSRPDKISQQQASTLGRLVLAFGNTPMQYARITKKAALDLLAGRGDFKTNMSKVLYYGMVQNIVFSGLQQALFSLWLDDEPDEDDEEVEKYVNVIDSAIDGFGRGLGYGGAIAVMVKNVVQEAMNEYGEGGRKNFQDVILEIGTLSPAISSKISRLEQGARTFTWKQELEKVRTEGVSLDNPAFEATGKFVSAITNVPLDRLIRKMDNLSYPVRHEIQTYQAIALALGWGQWELGLKEVNKQEKNKKPKVGFKKKKSTKKKI